LRGALPSSTSLGRRRVTEATGRRSSHGKREARMPPAFSFRVFLYCDRAPVSRSLPSPRSLRLPRRRTSDRARHRDRPDTGCVREATPETPTWNVVIVTTGIARRWFEDGLITARDTLVVDEIHQTSAELELCLALGKRADCRFVWLSATVDPSFYARYLGSVEVLETRAFDPAKAARVRVLAQQPLQF